jgi:hypothetical protein
MPCYSPLVGYRAKFVNRETGKRPIVFNRNQGFVDKEIKVPCGKCIGCRLEYSRQWAIRCHHEAQMHEQNAFITLTYAPEYLPDDRSINKEHLQKFFKRLRKAIGKEKLRYFACGEYGTQLNRPHYHAIIFGYGFPDKRLHTKQNGNLLFRSALLEKAWPFGYSLIGEATFESAAYVARYVTKKFKSKDEEETNKHYQLIDSETGEVHQVEPEFCLMSRRPGIGKSWLEKYHSDTDKDWITVRGKRMSLPKYYDQVLEKMGKDIENRKLERTGKFNKAENTYDRLLTREKVKVAQTTFLKRGLENES